jgi:hypothetical protein
VGAGGKEEEEDMAVDVIEEDGSDDHERIHAYGKRGCLSWLAPCPCLYRAGGQQIYMKVYKLDL